MAKLTVYKSNKVVEAGFKLSLNEQKIILACVAKNDSRQPLSVDDKFTITAKEFAEITGIEINHAYLALQDVADSLFNRYVVIDNPDATNPKIKRRKTRWISSIDYITDGGAISLRFACDMLPYLSELKSQFTKYELKHVGGMTSAYGIRLYELLTQYRTMGRREIQLDWLKSHFEIADAYKSIADLRRYVIEPAIDNINKHSDLTVQSPIYEKTGRKVTSVTFDFKAKEKPTTTKKPKPAPQPQQVDNLEHFAQMRKRFGNSLPLDAIPSEIVEQLKTVGRW
ncbi:MAG: RepB family plasmid replication initiator protein [Methylococcaceae bacterium]